jgi:2-polyprenyl-3-methyl-5-hydroxy-6-metoxy-1,4-benzoquinol methylase
LKSTDVKTATIDSDFIYKNNLEQKWSESDPFTLNRYAQFSGFIKNTDNVLDIGCNTGRGGAVMKNRFPLSSINGVELINERIARITLGIYDKVFNTPIQQIKGYDHYFDVIVAGELIEHIPPSEFESFLIKCNHLIKPDGLILFTTPNPGSFLVKLGRTKVYNDPSHVNILSYKQLNIMLNKCGLKLAKVKGSGKASKYIGSSVPLLGLYGSYLAIITK